MIIPRKKEAVHKMQLYRLLSHLVDDPVLNQRLFFKGGTAAAMLGWLDRFSVDLDFDVVTDFDKRRIDKSLKQIFKKLGFQIKDESKRALQFFLRYEARPGYRSSLKLEILPMASKANKYRPAYLPEIDRYVVCQTKKTMVANKLVALTDRYKKRKTIAGRDVYDIFYFLSQGFGYEKAVIEDRTRMKVKEYLKSLTGFVEKKVTNKIINQDLNYLLTLKRFNQIRKTLKQETIWLLKQEIKSG